MKIGDYVKWDRSNSTVNPGMIVGECRLWSKSEGNEKLLWLVLFEGSHSYDEPFAISENELVSMSPLELLAVAGLETK